MGLVDDIFKNINQGISDIKDKSQEVMQSISLSSRINSLEAKKTAVLVNIGQLVYDKYEKGDEVSEELLKDKVKEVAEFEKEIRLAREELEGLKTDPEAPRSQKAAAAAGYKPTPGFVCPHCQAPANANKYYCVACGGSLKETASGCCAEGNGDKTEVEV